MTAERSASLFKLAASRTGFGQPTERSPARNRSSRTPSTRRADAGHSFTVSKRGASTAGQLALAVASEYGGGTYEPVLRVACIFNLNENHLADLVDLPP